MNFPLQPYLDYVKSKKLTISKAFKQFENDYPSCTIKDIIQLGSVLLFGDLDTESQQAHVQNIKFPVGVCAKIISSFDIVYTCVTCSVISNSVYCSECFVKDLHIGHKIEFGCGVIGNCDCGDSQAIVQSSFCPKHQGFNEDLLQDYALPAHLKSSYKEVFKCLMKLLGKEIITLICASEKNERDDDEINSKEKNIIDILSFFENLVTVSLFFIKPLTDCLNTRYYLDAKDKIACSAVSFLNKEEEDKHKNILTSKKSKNMLLHICICKIIQLLFKSSFNMSHDSANKLYSFFVTISKSARFKILLCHGYITNYSQRISSFCYSDFKYQEDLRKASLQALSFDEPAMQLLTNPVLKESWFYTLNLLLAGFSEKTTTSRENQYARILIFAQDFINILKNEPSHFLIYKSTWILDYLTAIARAHLEEVLKAVQLQMHVEYENILIQINYYYPFCCKELLRVFRRILVNYDFFDIEGLCKPLGAHLKNLIRIQYSRYKEKEKCKEIYFYSNDVLKCFSIFLSIFIHAHILPTHPLDFNFLEWRTLKKEIRTLLKQVMDISGDKELDSFIAQTIELTARPLVFLLEALAKKWVNHGSQIQRYMDSVLGKRRGTSCDLDISLMQILLAAYGTKETETDFFWLFIELCDPSGWVTSYFKFADNPKEKQLEIVDERNYDKFSKLIEVFLFFICGLCTNDTICYKPFLRLKSKTEVPQKSNDICREKLEYVWKHYFNKVSLHQIYNFKNATVTFSDITSILPKKLRQNPQIEEYLKEICNTISDPKGGISFNIKKENLQFIEHYFPCFPYQSSISEDNAVEFMNKCHKQDKESLFDPVIGVFHEDIFGYIPRLFTLNLLESTFVRYIPFLMSKINMPINLENVKVESSEDVTAASIKILSLFAYNFPMLHTMQQETIIAMMTNNDNELVKRLKELSLNNQNYKQSVEKINKQFNKYEFGGLFNESIPKDIQSDKANVKEMQLKILNSFREKQELFFKKHNTEVQKEEKKVIVTQNESCTVCKEEINESHPFGKISFLHLTNILPLAVKKFTNQEKLLQDLGIASKKQLTGEIRISTCNHFLHFDCFTKVLNPQTKTFDCPLCKSLSTCIIPSISSTLKEEDVFFFDSLTSLTQIKGITPELTLYKVVTTMITSNVMLIDIGGLGEFAKIAELLQSVLFYSKARCNKNPEFVVELKDRLEKSIKNCVSFNTRNLVKWAVREYFLQDENSEDFKKMLNQKFEWNFKRYIALVSVRAEIDDKVENVGLLEPTKTAKNIIEAKLFKKEAVVELKKYVCLYSILCKHANLLKQFVDSPQVSEYESLCSILSLDFVKYQSELASQDNSVIQIIHEAKLNAVLKLENEHLNPFYSKVMNNGLTFELIKLPEQYIQLIMDQYPRVCEGCKVQRKEKSLCLLCGSIFCSLNTDYGRSNCDAINQHLNKCGNNFGIFIEVHSGEVTIQGASGWITQPSPYQNKFGESLNRYYVDQREKYLLNSKAYGEIEDLVLRNKIINLMRKTLQENNMAFF